MDATSNAAEIAALLDRMADRIKHPRDLVQAILFVVHRAAQARTPVATGTLQRSLFTRVLSPFSGMVGTILRYARFVHDGTRFMPGRPFLTDAAAAEMSAIDALVAHWGGEVVGG